MQNIENITHVAEGLMSNIACTHLASKVSERMKLICLVFGI